MGLDHQLLGHLSMHLRHRQSHNPPHKLLSLMLREEHHLQAQTLFWRRFSVSDTRTIYRFVLSQ